MTEGPGKEHGTNKPPSTRRVWERSKGDDTCPSATRNPSRWHLSWLSNVCATRKDPESEWLAKDNAETNPITIKPKTGSHQAEQFSWIPLPYCSPPGVGGSFPIKSLALSACVSPQTTHFRVLDKSPLSGPGRSPSSCNKSLLNHKVFPVHILLPVSKWWSLREIWLLFWLLSDNICKVMYRSWKKKAQTKILSPTNPLKN